MLVKKLELDCDNVIIGSGLAGLTAALRLKGNTIVLSRGFGATAISSGVLSFNARRDLPAEEWFLGSMKDTGCGYSCGNALTDMLVHREGLVQDIMAFSDDPAIISLNGQIPPSPGFNVRGIRFLEGKSYQEIAKLIETDPDVLRSFSQELSGIDAGSLLIPPVLGIASSHDIRERLQKELGASVYEYISSPSVHGMRLIQALRKKAMSQKNVMILDLSKADRIVEGRVMGRTGTKAKREFHVTASNLFIATGGPLTGLCIDGDTVYEPLTGMVISHDIEADLNDAFLSEHKIMRKGIGAYPGMKYGFDNARAIGAVAQGFGLYGALISGYHAGDDL
ncbi:glycerol-3-phosphate dehydrogenase [Methanocella sp. CWC-04]|uniref:Glycerol-3-phosphate dehydrogenase n=1 Tax=Methanooceanicella nereidis TaxID=2052831 RepID=A0AAP2RBT4_9EURY|nr:FAD-dependent oxidoreductase [Methanocella sp. CWC-04]MCD1293402.1 glycerol-3-phosphate dehydrogenase [Methanocella sp. CWC-04]